MKRQHIVVAGVVVLLAGALLWLFVLRGDGAAGTKDPAAGGPDRGEVVPGKGGHATESADPNRTVPAPTVDWPDPEGRLLVEGQVLGEDDQPVGGAEVWLSSQPPRSTKSEADGGFSFDKLLPREYSLSARSDDGVGGPVMVKVGPKMEPVVIRLREGATLDVRVTAEADGTPVNGATVSLSEAGEPSKTTDPKGVATFKAVGSGWSVVTVRASGFAPSTTITTIGAPGTSQEIAVALRKGAAVSGKVVDEAGTAIAGAEVSLDDAGSAWANGGDKTASGDDGTFTFPVVAAGSYRVSARDREHAPGVSEIVSVDGQSPRGDVVVTMKAGGTIRGRVVTKGREPAPFASVKVVAKDDDATEAMWGEDAGDRTVTADEQGAFEIKALPRAAMRLRAENDQAASAITDVDLGAQAVVENLELMLDVEGVIAGVVVDSAGDPVAEAQVSAFPDILSGGGKKQLDDLAFAGFTATTTDGGGAFRIHGLPEGGYRLWASRTSIQEMMFATEGTKASTGDTGVRIVLPRPGGIEGKIAYADGTTPERALVAVSILPASPAKDGAFEIRDLPPGKHDLRVRGPDFAELIKRDVVVEAGVIHDLGTLVVKRGRKVSGRVVDGAGQPIAGARVLAGAILFSEGKGGAGNQAIEEQMGVRSATTGADGGFVIQGAPEKGGSVMAEHADLGRSDSVPLAPGDADVLGLTLPLRGFGSVSGKVTMEGKALSDVQVMASAKGTTGHVVVVASGADGAFVIDKLPEGEHRLSANRMENFQMSSTSRDITVVAGKRTEVVLDIPVGDVTLTVEVRGKAGAQIDAAQVFLFRGSVAVRNAQDVTDRFLAGDAAGMGFWFGNDTWPSFPKLVPAEYSVCTLPINGNIADMQFQQRLQENLDKLDVHCQSKVVAASPSEQRHIATVPKMTPLPEE